MILVNKILLIIITFGGGVIVGGAITAFLTILQILARLALFTETENKIKFYELVMIVGFILSIIFYFSDFRFNFPGVLIMPIGLIFGIFIGILSSALAEVLNVIPVVAKKMKIKSNLKYLIWALVGGKVAGSLMYWILLN